MRQFFGLALTRYLPSGKVLLEFSGPYLVVADGWPVNLPLAFVSSLLVFLLCVAYLIGW